MNDAFLTALGLARRAGKLCFGFDSVADAANAVAAVYCAGDLSEKTKKNLVFALGNRLTPVVLPYKMETIGNAIGAKPVGIIGITDAGFAGLLAGKLNLEVKQ